MSWCDNEREHEREGRNDFERRGRYGYDHERARDRYYDDCAAAYMRGFERAQRDDDRRREEREEQERQELAAQARRQARRAEEQAMEEAYWDQYQQQYTEPPQEP